MIAGQDKWQVGNPDVFLYLAAVFIGVPLTMFELWHLGRTAIVAGLACLWIPTVVMLLVDFITEAVSRTSKAFFFSWLAVVLCGGIYVYVV